MQSQELNRQHQKIQHLISSVRSIPAEQSELQAHWARYICVLSAGFIENALSDVYTRYVKGCANEAVANFSSSKLNRIQNPKSNRFVETARSFKINWGEELNTFLDDNGRGDAINGIMSNRHLIAHGNNSGISLVRVTEYLSKSVEVIEYIEGQCGLD